MPRTTPQAAVKATHAIRRANLFNLVGENKRFPKQAGLAAALGVSESYLSHFLGVKPRRRITETSARKFEYKLGLRSGALDRE